MELKHIELKDLKTTTLNVRKKGAKNIGDILPSIRSLGVLQPLLVRKNCVGYEIVAGQRRFFAATKLAEEGITEPLPCIIMSNEDDAKAIEASLAENIARLPMDEIDQYKAFAALVKQGSCIEDIANQFGVTTRLIKQRLAIANLITPILNLYRKEEVGANSIRALTLATKTQQKAWLELFNSDDEYAPQGRALKEWLFGGANIPVENALFDLTEYQGGIITDLFGDTQYFDNADAFWELQNTAIAAKRDRYIEAGWSDVVLLDVGQRFYDWEHTKTTKKAGGRIYISIASNGEVKCHEGYISIVEAKRKEQQEAGIEDDTGKTERAELTKSMQNYLDLHRHAAVRNELLNHSGIALRLCVAQILAGANLWSVKAEQQKANTDAIAESLQTNKAQTAFNETRKQIREILNIGDVDEDTLVLRKDDWGKSYCIHTLFAKLQSLSDKQVNTILTFVVAETLPASSELVEGVGNLLDVEMAQNWSPDDTFFDLLRDKEAINAIVKEVGNKSAADAHIASTAKVQKKIICDYLDGTREGGKQDWQPRYITFPIKGYTKRGGIDAVEKWKRIKKHYA